MVVEDGVDLRDVDELADVDRARLLGLGGVELLLAEDDVLAIEVVAVADLLVRDLVAVLLGHALDLEPLMAVGVQLVEVDVEVADGAEQRDRHVDQAEGQRAAPDRPGHQRFLLPFRLASRAAIRSSEGSGGSGSVTSISSPAAFCSMSFMTRFR